MVMVIKMKNLWKKYSLFIVYLAGWLFCWGLHYFGLWLYVDITHEKSLFWRWFSESFENLASEYHQVGAFVLLSKYFIYEGSPQSKDGDDEMQQDIKEIKKHLKIS
jgi:hypothetical protein